MKKIIFGMLCMVFLSEMGFAKTVFLLRHAEKDLTQDTDDPTLTPEGLERARKLACILRNEEIEEIWSTPFIRTLQTVTPTAAAKNLSIQEEMGTTKTLNKILYASEDSKILVVGHVDTVPQLIHSLGGPKLKLEENEYDNLFILTMKDDSLISFVRLHF